MPYKHLLALLLMITACGQPEEPQSNLTQLSGHALGTSYNIRYLDFDRQLHREIDSIMVNFNSMLSTYQEVSLINTINDLDTGTHMLVDTFGYFVPVFDISKNVYRLTEGAFDPTIAPLVKAWGFGPKGRPEADTTQVDSVRKHVSFDEERVSLLARKCEFFTLQKNMAVRFDFNAVAKGYAVDVVCEYLETFGIENYFVEIGGEVRAKGINERDTPWRIAIDKPQDDEREFHALLYVRDRAVATSGNYRKYYEVDGVRYAHTIDPKTGYPVQHSLLSATVLAADCATADALATAFMVLGVEKTKMLLTQPDYADVDVYLIYEDESGNLATFISEGIREDLEEL